MAIEKANLGAPRSVIRVCSDVVNVTAAVRHHHLSQAEGAPTALRVYTPNTLALTDPISYASNYTDCASCTLQPVSHDGNFSGGGSFDFIFEQGIMYTDYVSLSFSLIVDPNERTRPGAGVKMPAVVLQPVCKVSQHSDASGALYPADVADFIACGAPAVVGVRFQVGDCDGDIAFPYACQVRASSQLSYEAAARNALDENAGRWSPAVRTGGRWRQHVDFDFLAVARLRRVSLRQHETGIRETTAKTVLVMKGSGPDSFEEVGIFDAKDVSFNETIQVGAADCSRSWIRNRDPPSEKGGRANEIPESEGPRGSCALPSDLQAA